MFVHGVPLVVAAATLQRLVSVLSGAGLDRFKQRVACGELDRAHVVAILLRVRCVAVICRKDQCKDRAIIERFWHDLSDLSACQILVHVVANAGFNGAVCHVVLVELDHVVPLVAVAESLR